MLWFCIQKLEWLKSCHTFYIVYSFPVYMYQILHIAYMYSPVQIYVSVCKVLVPCPTYQIVMGRSPRHSTGSCRHSKLCILSKHHMQFAVISSLTSVYAGCAGMQSNAGMPLFAGSSVPTYHPSLVPRGRAGSPHAPDMGLHPTSPEALDDLLKQLKTDRHTLEVS